MTSSMLLLLISMALNLRISFGSPTMLLGASSWTLEADGSTHLSLQGSRIVEKVALSDKAVASASD